MEIDKGVFYLLDAPCIKASAKGDGVFLDIPSGGNDGKAGHVRAGFLHFLIGFVVGCPSVKFPVDDAIEYLVVAGCKANRGKYILL